MAEYQCVFFAPPSVHSKDAACQPAERFHADTDELARLSADWLRRGGRNPVLGFELWQGSRLVCRRAAPRGDGAATTHSSHGKGASTDEG